MDRVRGAWRRVPRWGKVTLTVALTLVVVVGALAVWLAQPVEPTPYQDPVGAEQRAANTAVLAALHAGGLNNSTVDVTTERAVVAYMLPPTAYSNTAEPNSTGSEVNETRALGFQRMAVGATARVVPGVPLIHVFQYDGEDLRLSWAVQTEDFHAYTRGEITGDEFEDRIEETRY